MQYCSNNSAIGSLTREFYQPNHVNAEYISSIYSCRNFDPKGATRTHGITLANQNN